MYNLTYLSEESVILPSRAEMVVGLLSFIVVLIFVYKVFVPRVVSAIDARREYIKVSKENADKLNEEVKKIMLKRDKIISDTRKSIDNMRSKAEEEISIKINEAIESSKRESDLIVSNAYNKSSLIVNEGIKTLKDNIIDISIKIASNRAIFVNSSVDRSVIKRLVDKHISD